MQKQAEITSKGQITVPIEVRRLLGVREGDRLLFESDSKGVHIRPVRRSKSISKSTVGIGNSGSPFKGEKGINRWLREMRGHND